MEVANAFAHYIRQLGGPWRDPVGFVGSVKPVHAYKILRYRLDIKHMSGIDSMRLCLTTARSVIRRFVGLIQSWASRERGVCFRIRRCRSVSR